MCGIISSCSYKNIVPELLAGLKKLEYRGYDSAGLAGIVDDQLVLTKRVGKVNVLEEACQQLQSKTVIAHTRWATHGKPTECNAHPHVFEQRLAWVHNGIIHNHQAIRSQLAEHGYTFDTATDSEVIGKLLAHELSQGSDILTALQQTCNQLKGSYALVVLDREHPENLFFACHKSPLVIGIGNQEMFLASDPLALFGLANAFVYLQNNQIGYITTTDFQVFDSATLQQVVPPVHHFELMQQEQQNPMNHRHFMHKEIFEQPEIIKRCLAYYLHQKQPSKAFQTILQLLQQHGQIDSIHLIGCGSSYFAGQIGQYWFAEFHQMLTQANIASEYRHHNLKLLGKTLLLALSQSGETADTLYALDHGKSFSYCSTATLCNVSHSTMVRESDVFFPLLAGQEVGVASTKAFSTQLVVLLLIALFLNPEQPPKPELLDALYNLPELIGQTLKQEQKIEKLAWQLSQQQQLLFLGRGLGYPTALEGALKLKELSYIHAHAYPAGELKHGPLALIDHKLITIGLLPDDHLREKNLASFREIQARNGKLVVFYQGNTDDLQNLDPMMAIELPNTHNLMYPVVFSVAMQLLAYHIARQLGHDVDQPRNLAKSVTVE